MACLILWLAIYFVSIFNENQVIDNKFLIDLLLFFKEESRTIKDHIDKGLLLPDELVLKFVVDELEKNREQGFLLDGKMKYEARILYFVSLRLSKNIKSN